MRIPAWLARSIARRMVSLVPVPPRLMLMTFTGFVPPSRKLVT